MPKGPFTSHGRQSTLRTQVGSRDARTGLGYGVLEPKNQLPRSMGSIYPYYEKEELDPDDEEIDQETSDAVSKKYSKYQPSDFYRAAGSEPFYFVAGNTKLSDCFFRTSDVLNEIAAFGDSMTGVPGKYKGLGGGMGGSGAAFPYQGGGGTNYKRTGTTQGWSHAPAPISDEEKVSDEEEDEPIFTLRDLAKQKIKKVGEEFAGSNI